jgi:hypothetical protein
MMKARLDQLFALEAPDKSAADSTQLRLPTLEERVELYLRAVHGKPDVTREQYLRARDLILDAMATRFSGDTVVGPANKPSDHVGLPGRPVSLADETISLVDALRLGPVQQAASASPSDELEGPPTGPDVGLGSPAAMPPAWKLSKHRRFIGGFSVGFTAVLLLGVGIHIVTLFSTDGGKMTALAPSAPVFAPSAPVFHSPPLAALPERMTSKLQLNDEEIGTLVARGRKLIQAGDIGMARLVLEQAAEADNATAALELGATYDPTFLQPAMTDMGDVRMAALWYEKAKDLGSTEAAVRLERLRSAPNPRR